MHPSHLPPAATRRHRIFRGLNERQEHIFTWIAVAFVLLYVTAWVAGVSSSSPTPAPAQPTQQITSQLLEPDTPAAPFLTDAMLGFLNPLRGASGKVRFTTLTPGSPIARGAPSGTEAVLSAGEARSVSPDFAAPEAPGIYNLAVQLNQAMRQIDNFSVVTLVPFSEKRSGRIGLYFLGSWPFERGGRARPAAYENPSGFIEVTPENANTFVSEHFRLRDFLTRDQPNVWPKYLLLNPKLLDKLELTIQELEAMGHPVRRMIIMSGFRTPQYNHTGGNIQGRANLSRHMYGDAADVFVDNDGNGVMDDLNGDGRVDVRDAEIIQQAVERVERNVPSLVGGVGVYSACCGHGPFAHIDVRGFRARWRGTGNG